MGSHGIDFNKIVKDVSTFPNYLFLALVIIIIGLQLYTVAGLQRLPSPVYGGDLYRDRAFSQSILNGKPIYSDPYISGEYAFYPDLGYMLIAGITYITGIALDRVIIYFPILLTPIFCLIIYLLAKELGAGKKAAIAVSSIFVVYNFLNMKFSTNLGMLFTLIFLIYLMRVLKSDPRWVSKNQVLAGLFMGLAALSHYTAFFSVVAFTISSFVIESAYQGLLKRKNLLKAIGKNIKKYLAFCIIGAMISMVFFYPIIFIYHLHTLNPTNSYAGEDVSTLGFSWLFKVFIGYFINLSSAPLFIIGIIMILGIVLTATNIKNTGARQTIAMLLGAILLTGHYIITLPLFNFSIVPGNLSLSLLYPAVLLIISGLLFLEMLANKVSKGATVMNLFYILVFVLILSGIIVAFTNAINDRFMEFGKSKDPSAQVFDNMQRWILKNTQKNDVFLSGDESSFMITGISGRNVVFSRRVHASAYVDMEKRYADGVMMMYCHDLNISRKLLDEYNVTYLYIDGQVVQSAIIVNEKYRSELDRCNITYSIQDVPLEPSVANAKKFESLVVPPQNITAIGLTKSSSAVPFYIGSNIFSVIYPINR